MSINETKDKYAEPTRIFNRGFVSIFIISMTFNYGQSSITAILGKYADVIGLTGTEIGIILSGFAIVSLILRFIAGPAMDRLSRKYLLFFSMSCIMVSYAGFGLSHSFTALLIFRLLQGIGVAFGNACCMVIASETLPKNKFKTGMGYFSCSQVLSQAFASSIALWLAESVGWMLTFFITAFVMCVSICITLTLRSTDERKTGTDKFLDRKNFTIKNIIAKEAVFPAIIILFASISATSINNLIVVSAAKQGIENGIGFYFTIYFVVMLATRPVIGALCDRFGVVKISIPALLITAGVLCLLSRATELWMFLSAAALSAFGYGAIRPALMSLCLESVPIENRGSASTTCYIGIDLGTLIGPVIAGRLSDVFGYSTMWMLMTIPIVLSILFVIAGRKKLTQIEVNFDQQKVERE